MTPLNKYKVKGLNIIYGDLNQTFKVKPLNVFNIDVLQFLEQLSQELIKDIDARKYSDVIAFAYFCRKANLKKIMNNYRMFDLRYGIGTVFHFTPTNVPINFAFSIVFSLLGGNSNIVRLSERSYVQYDIVLNNIIKLLDANNFCFLKNFICVVKYSHNTETSELLLSQCAGRIIWGGDRSVEEIKKIKVPHKFKDLVFGDRFSASIIDSQSIIDISDHDLENLINHFYNDTLLYDQNACSSSKIIIWIGHESKTAQAKNIFWSNMDLLIQKKYEIAPSDIIEKFTDLCILAMSHKIDTVRNHNLLYRIKVNKDTSNEINFTNKLGSVIEITSQRIQDIELFDRIKLQTLTYFGFSKNELIQEVRKMRPRGVDRIVPIGRALDINVFWDGYDIISELSRIIHIE